MDFELTILEEYKSQRNMPDFQSYGRRVVQHKIETGAICWVTLEYWNNGDEKVAKLPQKVEDLLHDLGDRKMVAAASTAAAVIVNACDSDWTNEKEQEALQMLGIEVLQILTDEERVHCRGPQP